MIPLYISGSTHKSSIGSTEFLQAVLPHVAIKLRMEIDERYAYIRLTNVFLKYLVKRGFPGFRSWYLDLTPYQAASLLESAVTEEALATLKRRVKGEQARILEMLQTRPLSTAEQNMMVRLTDIVQSYEYHSIKGLKKYDEILAEYKEAKEKEKRAAEAKPTKKSKKG